MMFSAILLLRRSDIMLEYHIVLDRKVLRENLKARENPFFFYMV